MVAVRPDTPEDGGKYGVTMRRNTYPNYGGSTEYIQFLNKVVVALMVEKKGTVDHLEEILSSGGIDMVQWGPADYSMNVGLAGKKSDPKVKAAERLVFEKALEHGVPARAEIASVDQAKYFLDMGVRHFSLGTDIGILFNWLKESGAKLRKLISGS